MASVEPGQSYTPLLQISDEHGSPIEAGIVGTMTLYGPGSTAALAGPTALAFFGDGWGVTFPGSATTALGEYRVVTSAITGAAEMEAQTLSFTVGRIPAAFRTLRDCVVDLAVELDAGIEGRSTGAGGTTSLVDSGRANANLGSDEWVDSELLILEPASVSDRNPVTVTGFNPASGTFTFAPALAGATTAGQDYLLLNLRGDGVSFGKLKRAIVAAWREVSPGQLVVDEVNYVTDTTYRLAVPARWREIEAVQVRYGSSGPWSDIAEAYRPHDPHLGYLNFTQPVGAGRQLRLVGTVEAPEPEALTSVVSVPYGWLRDRVLGEIWSQSKHREDQQRAAVHLARADRRRPR